jgi:hypothetical protein
MAADALNARTQDLLGMLFLYIPLAIGISIVRE